MIIEPNHPLARLFRELVQRRFCDDWQIRDGDVTAYISALLSRFTHVRELYRIRNARGKRLEDVGEMLIESNPLLEASSFGREREVRKHIGDYSLFLCGLFPEMLPACLADLSVLTPSRTMSGRAKNRIASYPISTSSSIGARHLCSVSWRNGLSSVLSASIG